MQKLLLLWLALYIPMAATAQHTFNATIKDAKTKETLIGATAVIKGTTTGASADINGKLSIVNVPPGKHIITISFIGYEAQTDTFNFPIEQQNLVVYLQPIGEELDEVIVSSTRTSRSIDDVPTRIEAIGLEEIEEKSNMRPGNVTMMLHESTGLQVQQTSAANANQSIRIQGLDGKYTQIIKDGFPTFGGFSSGLSLLEIPPLDLKQIEVIKGAASTLYGGGAIAGVVNFVSKTPREKPENSIILNQTTAGGSDAAAYFSRKYNRWGFTLLTNGSLQKAYDVNKDDFTEIPESKNGTILPKLFYYINDSTTLSIGNQSTFQRSIGGDINVINGNADVQHTYSEENKSTRNITYLNYEQGLQNNSKLTIKQSFSYFDRTIALPSYLFGGKQYNAFTDITYLFIRGKHTILTGSNYYYDQFKETYVQNNNDRSNTQNTIGIYLQDTWDVTEKWKLESGLRTDYNDKYGIYVLPRVSGLYKINSKLSSRLGAGAGYKTPTIFTEQTETNVYRNVLPVSADNKSEQSIGSTFDLNYKTPLWDNLFFTINQMFFYTYITKPLILQHDTINNIYVFNNESKSIVSRGFETNVKLGYNDFKLFIGYTYTDAEGRYQQGNIHLPLIPRNKVNIALVYEKPNSFKAGFEAYFSDHQYLSDESVTPTFYEMGFMAEKIWRNFSLFANFENFTDTRQSKLSPTALGTHSNPVFPEIYTHTEGFVTNVGLKIKW